MFFFFSFTFNSSVNATRISLNGVCPRTFLGKGIVSLCGVVVRYKHVELGPTQYLIFFFSLLFLNFLFSLSCCFLNNSYLIKCNKQQETYRVFREKIVHSIKYMDKQSEFQSFPTIYCGKIRVGNHLIIF